jgi:hypothetical protein
MPLWQGQLIEMGHPETAVAGSTGPTGVVILSGNNNFAG